MRGLAFFFLGLGMTLLLTAIALGQFQRPDPVFLKLYATTGIGGSVIWVRGKLVHWRQKRNLRRHRKPASDLATTLIPQLQGEYTPYVIEAAGRLGEARDMTAVPALMELLEGCVNHQNPGWRDVAAAVADALAQIGDVRSLPHLKRLENVRGIGLIPNIRKAIAIIEPQANLLRPGPDEDNVPQNLLRPAQSTTEEPSLMLRAVDSTEKIH